MKKIKPLIKKWQKRLLFTLWRMALIGVAASVFLVLMMRWLPPPTTSFVLQDQVSYWWQDKTRSVKHHWVGWQGISPHMALAVVAAEDQRFMQHAGFDFDAIQNAVAERLNGGRLRGASTISQQVAKNLFLWRDQNLLRKGVEAYFTLMIELFWSKQRILEVYLNAVEFGPGIYGVAAASEYYFHKKPADLAPHEAALLAAVLPSPKRMRVDEPSDYVRSRQHAILEQMRHLGGTKYMNML